MRQTSYSRFGKSRTPSLIQAPMLDQTPMRTFYAKERQNLQRQNLQQLSRFRDQLTKVESTFPRRNKHRRKSQINVVRVASKIQEQLMTTFLSPRRNLSIQRTRLQDSPLSKILKKRDTFKQGYFEQIDKTRVYLSKNKKKYHEMPAIQIGRWQVKGIMSKKHLLVRASDGKKEISQKYLLCDPYPIAKQYYEQMLREKFDELS